MTLLKIVMLKHNPAKLWQLAFTLAVVVSTCYVRFSSNLHIFYKYGPVKVTETLEFRRGGLFVTGKKYSVLRIAGKPDSIR